MARDSLDEIMEKPRVLVVDDSPIVRAMCVETLEKHDLEVLTAKNGQEACHFVFNYQPDVVMMDLVMPVMNGMSAIRLLKSHYQTQHIPIIVFTSESSLEEKVNALEAGANDFLSKDADEAELIARVKSLLRVKRLEDSLLQEKIKLSSILNDLAEAVVILDTTDRVILSNNAASNLLNIPPELVGTLGVEKLVEESDKADDLMEELKQDRLINYTLERETSYGRKTFKVSSNPVYLSYGETLGKALVFRDVTKEIEMEKMKTDFYSMIAHDLRSPISVITGYSSLLLDGKAGNLERVQREFIEAMQTRALSMLKLVDEFLTVSKFEASFISLDLAEVNVNDLLEEVVKSLSLIASNKQISVEFKKKERIPKIQADSHKLQKVFSNLLDNAIKYTPEGGSVKINIRRLSSAVRVEVKDSGIGIGKEELKFVFERFKRTHTAKERKIKGTGLGLTIVKEIVNAHKGKVTVESEVGKGSTFIVTLPIGKKKRKKAKETKMLAEKDI